MIYARAFAFLVFCSATIIYASASDQTCSAGDETCTSPECQDDHEHCSFWASEGEVRNKVYWNPTASYINWLLDVLLVWFKSGLHATKLQSLMWTMHWETICCNNTKALIKALINVCRWQRGVRKVGGWTWGQLSEWIITSSREVYYFFVIHPWNLLSFKCEINPAYMLQNCKLSCNVCHDPEYVKAIYWRNHLSVSC